VNQQSTEKRLVFVSHRSQDTWIAKQIAREIETRGATPFLDEAQVDAGADFEEDILNFLERAHELVVLLTPWTLERPYVWAEIGAAWGGASQSWHCCSASPQLNCSRDLAYRSFSRSEATDMCFAVLDQQISGGLRLELPAEQPAIKLASTCDIGSDEIGPAQRAVLARDADALARLRLPDAEPGAGGVLHHGHAAGIENIERRLEHGGAQLRGARGGIVGVRHRV